MTVTSLCVPLQPRSKAGITQLKDSHTKNCFFEHVDNEHYLVKRPGLFAVRTQFGSTDVGQGLYSFGPNNHPVKVESGQIKDAVTNTIYGTLGSSFRVSFTKCFGSGSTPTNPLVFINGRNTLVTLQTSTGTVTTVTGPSSAPFPTYVPGVVCLNTTTYVLDNTGKLYNSNVSDAFTWGALNFVTVNQDGTRPIALTTHLNYLIAFTEESGVVYSDVGNTTGSPLQRYDSACFSIGCSAPYAIGTFEQGLIWIGKRDTSNNSVWILNGLTPQKISTPYVDRFFDGTDLSSADGYVMKFLGHEVYVLHLRDVGVTLVYDIMAKQWYLWSSIVDDVERCFDGYFYCENRFEDSNCYLMNYNGSLYQFKADQYTDQINLTETPINVEVQTSRLSFGTNKNKLHRSLQLVDDIQPSTVDIYYSDNDYSTWTGPKTVSLAAERPIVYQLGISRQRAYKFVHTGDTAMRLYGFELEVEPMVF